MAYSEELRKDGLLTRKYFGLDSSGIFRMYYNGEFVKFPTKTLMMGKGNEVGISIDMKKFVKNFILKKAFIRIKISNSSPRGGLVVHKSKNISSIIKEVVGKMEKDKRGYFVFDVTELLLKQINTTLNLTITTTARLALYTLFAFYDSKAEFIVQYYDDSYLGKDIATLKLSKNKFYVNRLNGVNILERSITKVGFIDLKLIVNSHHNKFMFNYNQYIDGGINNYKYIDSLGNKHYFKLTGRDEYKTHSDIFDQDTILESGHKYLIKKNDKCLTFNSLGQLVEIQDNKSILFLCYEEGKLVSITDNLGNFVKLVYVDNNISINDSEGNEVKVKMINNTLYINNTRYYFNQKNQLYKTGNVVLEYDSINRIKKIKHLKNEIKINYKKKEGIKNDK